MPPFSELALLESPFAPGLTVIEASAGTGKTYSISHLVPRLLLEGVLPDLSKLLLVTFTNDAARELAERVRRVLTRLATPPTGDEVTRHPHVSALRRLLDNPEAKTRLDRALLDLDLLAVSTINAFCQRTLQQEGSFCGLPVLPEVTTDDSEHLETIVHSLWTAELSADATVAALATGLEWKLADALKLINALRRAQSPQIAPLVPPYSELRQAIATQCAALADNVSFQSFATLIGRVSAWNKGVESSDAALARVRPLSAGETHTLTYWQSLDFAEELPGKITAKSPVAKALKTEVVGHRWLVAAAALTAITRRLEWAWQQHLAAAALPRLAALLVHRRLITQDGLIGGLYHALHRETAEGKEQSARLAAHLAARYQVALIDESQDTDPRQLAIFQRIFNAPAHPRRLILVGDPKQAIYSFRGADLGTYLAARSRADAGYTLTHTHRAPRRLVETVNGLFKRDRGFHHPDMRFVPAKSALQFDRQLFYLGSPCSRLEAWIVPETESDRYSAKARRISALSARVATTIVELLHDGELRTTYDDNRPTESRRVTPRDCAVLVATHEQAQGMAEALQALDVPVVINSGADIFATDEARELHIILRALLDPRRTARLRSALATRLMGLDASKLAALEKPGTDGQQPSVVWLDEFERWNKTWMTRGLTALFAALDDSTRQTPLPSGGITLRLALVPLTGERRATNYRHLTDLLLEAARDAAPRPDELVRWLGQQIARSEERSQNEEHQLQLSSDRPAVQIVTMHKAKGLEYPLVFCPYLADPLKSFKGVVHRPASRTNNEEGASDLLVNLGLLDDATKALRTQELMAAQLEERLRVAYVSLTRAQVRVWICTYGSSRGDNGSPLDWMLRTEADLASYPTYSDDWVRSAKTGRSARHSDVLRSLGAQPHVEEATDQPTPLITLRDPPLPSPARYAPAAHAPDALPPDLVALPAPVVPPSWRITSFSTLTKEKHAHGGPLLAAPPAPAPATAVETPALAFLASPGGAAVGTVVHDWIETWDLSPPDAEALARHLKTTRPPEPRADQPAWPDALHELFSTLRLICLPGCGDTPLHELCPEPHGSEWHFHLPLAGALTVGALARCFEDHADPAHRPYAASLAALSDEKFQGLLQGYIDRLARQGPAWGVIDWKTNRLGATLGDYDQAALLRCAMQDHYLLQTHLYLVALRRYLRALGLADQPLAGAWLVFLRAIAPGETRGVLHINPPAAMLDALDRLFAPALRPLV